MFKTAQCDKGIVALRSIDFLRECIYLSLALKFLLIHSLRGVLVNLRYKNTHVLFLVAPRLNAKREDEVLETHGVLDCA